MHRMKKIAPSLLLLLLLMALAAPAFASGTAEPGLSADEALKMLKDGNARFVDGKAGHPHQDAARRALTAGQGQHPLAALLSCSDSRAPVELIFDQGLGDLFVVRVAGNVAATDEIGSMEYAVDHLGTPVVLVLGHSQCGAVTAVVEGGKLPGSIGPLVAPIKPAVTKAKAENLGAAAEVLIAAAIKNNVFQAMEDILQKSPVIKAKVKAGKVKLVGAIYELDTGKVQWLGALPGQEKLLSGKAPAKAGKKSKKPPE
ncbi:MAG: carbonic anhydrase [Deltaproteobacteria bacterium]|nr:carbonic anhydrase [Deltaproteobacteria bacterium]